MTYFSGNPACAVRITAGIAAMAFIVLLQGCVVVADVSNDRHFGGSWQEEERSLGVINRVEFGSRGTLYIVQGGANRLIMEGDARALDRVGVVEQNGALVITQDSSGDPWWAGSEHKGVVFRLEIDTLTELRQGGHSNVYVGPFSVDDLVVRVRDHANLKFSSINARRLGMTLRDHASVSVETLDSDAMNVRLHEHAELYAEEAGILTAELNIRDHGEVWLAGNIDTLIVSAVDHGDANLGRLRASVADIRAVDHAALTVWAEESLSVDERDNAQVITRGRAATDADRVTVR